MQNKLPVKNRTGEKIGWIGGGTGAVLWIGIIGMILLTRGETIGGLIGVVLMIVGLFSVYIVSPWRFPKVRYMVLLLPLYSVLLLSIGWAFIFLDDSAVQSGNPWSLFIIIPLLVGLVSPMYTIGKKRWIDGEGG